VNRMLATGHVLRPSPKAKKKSGLYGSGDQVRSVRRPLALGGWHIIKGIAPNRCGQGAGDECEDLSSRIKRAGQPGVVGFWGSSQKKVSCEEGLVKKGRGAQYGGKERLEDQLTLRQWSALGSQRVTGDANAKEPVASQDINTGTISEKGRPRTKIPTRKRLHRRQAS